MDRDELSERLRSGLSLAAIAREWGCDPSTVRYWIDRHGLAGLMTTSPPAREPVTSETLRALVDEGLSLRQISTRVGRSQTAVRAAIGRLGLSTARSKRRDENRKAREQGSSTVRGHCPVHGAVDRRADTNGTFRCQACVRWRVARHRTRVKAALVAEAGGVCRLCGYDRCLRALEFHHLDPKTKSFGLAYQGQSRSLARARLEAAKCVLLCSNCHMEVEAGLVSLGSGHPDPGERAPG